MNMASNFGYDDAYQVAATGVTVVCSSSSQSVTIPNTSNGSRARFVRLMVTGNAYVKFSSGAGTATTNDMLLSPNFDVIVSCRQFDTISYIQESAGPKLNILPLEA